MGNGVEVYIGDLEIPFMRVLQLLVIDVLERHPWIPIEYDGDVHASGDNAAPDQNPIR